jgi:P-type E1-E2 ATPase
LIANNAELKAEQPEFPVAVWQCESSWNGVAILARGCDPVLTRASVPGNSENDQTLSLIVGNTALLNEASVKLPARSVSAGTRVLVARDGQFAGAIHIADQVRERASEAIRDLQKMGIQIELLTGDGEMSANAVAESLGIRTVSSSLLPEQKSASVSELIHLGRTVAMVGDGINDALALSLVHVGAAMGSLSVLRAVITPSNGAYTFSNDFS